MKEVERSYLKVNLSHRELFSALSSDTRLKILELIQNKKLSIQDISSALGLSSASITKHVNILESAGIIRSYSEKGIRGRLKMCEMDVNEMVLIFNNNYEKENKRTVEKNIPVGSFTDFDISAPCGLASKDALIGYVDNPDVFYHPEKESIQHVWFSSGYVTYHIPTYDVSLENLETVEISFEISSEYPGYNNNFKSDIDFTLNGLYLATWTAPGDYGDRKGHYTPGWWELGSEYGDLVSLKISDSGTYVNGIKAGNCSLNEILTIKNNALTFSVISPSDSENSGGLNLFGEKFGDHAQHIHVTFFYED